MKPHSCTTPLAGYNVRGVPVRVKADSVPTQRQWCAMAPCENRAEVIFGARPACLSCAVKSRAIADDPRWPMLTREGDRAGLEAVVP